ncbi:MAG: beta-galactosidase [Anaerolinea sp.]|nr:beta-galactosidase [Anaerolinea sp.]
MLTQEAPLQLWAFLENSDFQRIRDGELYRQDEVKLIRHDEFLRQDYQLLVELGVVGVRDAARWYITHPAPHTFDWTWLDQLMAVADDSKMTLYLDLWHYGYPDWLDLLAPDAPLHFAEFARAIALRYPQITHWCVCNEPSLMVEMAGRVGKWRPFLRRMENATKLRRQISRMIIAGSQAILDVRPDARLILPEPWHATLRRSEDYQAAVIDTVIGRRDPELGGDPRYVSVIGLNHYRDSTLPPLHQLLINARRRWQEYPLWLTETSGPPRGWQQTEWFWWMLAEIRLANLKGADIPVFTWAPVISMYDWVHEKRQLANGIWVIGKNGERKPNGRMLEAIALARELGYLC